MKLDEYVIFQTSEKSPSLRRVWVEIVVIPNEDIIFRVTLLAEGVG